MNKQEFIKNQLSTLPLVDWSNPKQASVLCPYHDDTRPSLNISLVRQPKSNGRVVPVGVWNCFACKEHGSWNKLAQRLGLAVWNEKTESESENAPDNPFLDLARDIESLDSTLGEYIKPITDGPWEGSWRGLSGSFLRSIGAESLWDKIEGEYRVYLPIHDAFGKAVGHVLARGDNSKISDKKKYINSKGFNGRAYWYGLNYEPNPKVVVIVEGPFDMLRFRSEGIPAIANLGVQMRKEEDLENTISEEKAMQILSKGCTKVILALDADTAGRDATVGMTASFRKHGFEVYDLNLSRYLKHPEEKMDPGNCPNEVILDLKNFIASLK